MKIKTGDTVRVLAGKDKGKEGKVQQVFPSVQRIVVEGVNLMTRHLRGRGRDAAGQTVRFPSPIHVSNVTLVSPRSGAAGRAGVRVLDQDGRARKVRVIRSKGSVEEIE